MFPGTLFFFAAAAPPAAPPPASAAATCAAASACPSTRGLAPAGSCTQIRWKSQGWPRPEACAKRETHPPPYAQPTTHHRLTTANGPPNVPPHHRTRQAKKLRHWMQNKQCPTLLLKQTALQTSRKAREATGA